MEFFNSIKKNMKRKLSHNFPTLYKYISYYKGFRKPIQLFKSQIKLNKIFKDLNGNENKDVWKKVFRSNLWSNPSNIEIAYSFIYSNLQLMKKSLKAYSGEVILICVVKNDLVRMKSFFRHYRKIGINKFVIIDNGSNDGTLEFLLEQTDTDVYSVKDKFYSKRKYGWINKVLYIYGFNQWYLYADSDELFVFEGIESKNIRSLIHCAENQNKRRVSSLMVDMYSEKEIFSSNIKESDIFNELIYFDTDSYQVSTTHKGLAINGGPRKRVLSQENNWKGPLLIKHPLFYFIEGEMIESAHYIFPFIESSPPVSALLHYKFTNSDLARYKQIAKDGNFSNGSKEYKQYIKSYEKNKRLSFMYANSKMYTNSSSLRDIPIIKNIDWE